MKGNRTTRAMRKKVKRLGARQRRLDDAKTSLILSHRKVAGNI